MRGAFFLVIASLCVAIVYGVAFQWAYPHAKVGDFAVVLALAGFVTCGLAMAALRLFRGRSGGGGPPAPADARHRAGDDGSG